MTTYTNALRTCGVILQKLRRAFPQVRFNVQTVRATIFITWKNGPRRAVVKSKVSCFEVNIRDSNRVAVIVSRFGTCPRCKASVFHAEPGDPINCRIWKLFQHGNVIALCAARTSADWFHEVVVPKAELLCFPDGKTKFHRADESIGAEPGTGIVLIGAGEIARKVLRRSRLGFCVTIDRTAALLVSRSLSAHHDHS